MRRIAIILLGVVVFIFLLFIISKAILHEGKPLRIDSKDPNIMADNMLTKLNKPAWDSLEYLRWSFPGAHEYIWNKSENLARISWKNKVVHLDLNSLEGKVFVDNREVIGKKKAKLIRKAFTFWCNDSFWLFAPYKIRDPGTELYVAADKKGEEGLLVRYKSGGVTPGDEYLWFIGKDGLPTGVKMWVKVLPFGGLYTKWTNWEELYNGAKISNIRQFNIGNYKMQIENIKSGKSWESIGFPENPILINS